MITEATASGLRKTGIDVIDDVPWGTHFCCFYETKQDLLETLVAYFKTGLENNEFCLWVVSHGLTLEEARRTLELAVPDLKRHLEEGALEIHSHAEWYLRDGRYDSQRVLQSWQEKINHALANGYAGLRASGDGGWVQNDDWVFFREYEKQVESLIADRRRLLLCTYPLNTSSGEQVFDVARIHQRAVARRKGSWEIIETSELKEAKTEIKRLNEELEQRVIERTRELGTANEELRKEITERNQIARELRESQQQYESLVHSIDGIVWEVDAATFRFTFVSKQAERILGYPLAQWLEPSFWADHLHPEDRDWAIGFCVDATQRREDHRFEYRMIAADGRVVWLRDHVTVNVRMDQAVRLSGVMFDITERKEVEKQSRALIDAIPQQIWSGPADGTLDYCNQRWRAYMGLEQEDLRGDEWQRMLHPEDRDRVLKAWRRSVANGTPYEQEERHRGAHGKYRWFLVRGVPLRDAEGRIVRWYGTNTDIEGRKRAEAALHAQALRYKTLMATSTDSIYVLDEKGALREANAAFLRRRGYTAEEAKGLNVSDWDARWGPEQLEERRRQLVGSSAVFETRHRCKDGTVFDVEVCATGVRIDGEQLIICVTRDITERKQAEDRLRRSEEKFKTLFGIAPVGISVLDPQLNIVEANPALERITRLSREELFNGVWRHREYFNADGIRRLPNERVSERAISENQTLNDVETAIVMENGEIIWVQVSVAPLALPDASAVVITQDITERKRAAEALEQANRQLRILSRQLFHIQEEERRHLARELHDEIGQTLTAAKINLKIIAGEVPANVTGRLDDSIQLIDRLLRQVRQLSLDLRPPLLDELGLVPTLRWLVDQQAQRAGLRVTFTANVDGLEIHPDIQTNCFRVAQEAITNIIRHSGAKNVAVELRCEEQRLWLSVRDDGVGFEPAAIQPRAMRHSTLGLVSMKERALLVGGAVQIHSAPRQGTEVRAWFPLVSQNSPSSAQNA